MGMWRTGVYDSILLGLILYLSTLPLGKSSNCAKKYHACSDPDNIEKKCCSNLACYKDKCETCKHWLRTCSYSQQNCCKGFWCNIHKFEKCTLCKEIGDSCSSDVECGEGHACNRNSKCQPCIVGNAPCTEQICCEGFMCSLSAEEPHCVPCMTYGHSCPHDIHDDVKCCSDLTCMNNFCSQCKRPGQFGCSYPWQNCCKGFWCDSIGHCRNCFPSGDSCSINVQCCGGHACNELSKCAPCVTCNETCSPEIPCCEGFVCTCTKNGTCLC